MQGDEVLKERFARLCVTKLWAKLSGKRFLTNEAKKAVLICEKRDFDALLSCKSCFIHIL